MRGGGSGYRLASGRRSLATISPCLPNWRRLEGELGCIFSESPVVPGYDRDGARVERGPMMLVARKLVDKKASIIVHRQAFMFVIFDIDSALCLCMFSVADASIMLALIHGSMYCGRYPWSPRIHPIVAAAWFACVGLFVACGMFPDNEACWCWGSR